MTSHPSFNRSISQFLEVLNKIGVRPNDSLPEPQNWDESTVDLLAAKIHYIKSMFAPIHRLTTDSLVKIFRLVANQCHAINQGSWESHYGWIAISHVCRHWRDVALGNPSIWSIIDTTCPAIARMCLKNSRTSGLDLRLLSGYPEAFFEELQPHVSRIHSLHCLLTLEERNTLYPFLQDVPAPRLRHLSIESIIHDTSSLPLLFQGHTPSLQHIRLSGVSLGNAWGHINTLTSLELLHDAPHSALGMTDFLDFLQANTALQRIHINSAGPRVEGVNSELERRISLPHLRELTLIKCAIKRILNHIALPHDADLFIEGLDAREGLAAALPNSIVHLENTTNLGQIGVWGARINSCYIYGTGASGGAFTVKATNPPVQCLDMTSVFDFGQVGEIWLKEITCNTAYVLLRSGLSKFFFSLTATTTLVLLKCQSRAIIEALQPIDGRLPSPTLLSLTLYDVSTQNHELIEFAQIRAEHRHPLHNISFICFPRRLSVPAEVIMRLKAYVKVVEYKVDDQGPEAPANWFK